MIVAARKMLRRRLSPQAYRHVRTCWWNGTFYLPRLVASFFVRRSPMVQGFPGGQTSELVRQLRAINVLAPTEMCRVMTRHGSDKGDGSHNYSAIYSTLLGKLRDRPLRIF